jgi:hypothetical protein
MKMHPHYFKHTKRVTDVKRDIAEDVTTIQLWYNALALHMEAYGVQANDIYNFDETGFQIG